MTIYVFFCHHCSPTKALAQVDVNVTALQLADSFERNEGLSDSLYLYKVLSVKGVVKKITKSESGNYIALLGGGPTGKAAVDCDFDTLYNQRVFPLRSGDSVTIRGTCAGRLLNVILVQCIIEK